ncbi:MAG: pyridoxamine 5'-phosphate oxidase family protein [Spongiibacteraceae bacterium]
MHNAFDTPSDVAFTPSVKALQTQKGSREAYARMEQSRGWETRITAELKAFIEAQTSVFLATANSQGQPYIQHRGGPPGFLHVLDEHTIAFADFAGNRQYITTGNLAENAKAHLFLIDYANQRRVKIWCTAEAIEGDLALQKQLTPPDYRARVERVIRLTVVAWDANCPQHIPQKIDATDIERALALRDQRIAELESKLKKFTTSD